MTTPTPLISLSPTARHRAVRLGLMMAAGLALWTVCPAFAEMEPADDSVAVPGITQRLDDLIHTLRAAGFDWDDAGVFEQLVDTFVRTLDAHGGLDTPDAAQRRQRRREGWVYGPGIQLAVTNGNVVVASIRSDVPTDHPLQVGDKVLEVDTHQAEKRGLFALTQVLRNTSPEPLTLVTRDDAGLTHTQQVARVAYQVPAIERAEVLPFQLGYLQINRLRADSGPAIVAQLQQWAEDGLYGVLLDLRGADGDDLDAVTAVASCFAEEGTFLYAYRDREDQDQLTARAAAALPQSFPVMVLVDETTAGAAEVLAAVLRDSVRGAMLFGRPTAGDYLVHETLTLADGLRIRLATRQLVTGNGTVYTGSTGLAPSVQTAAFDPRERESVRSGRTEVLEEEVEQQRLFYRIRGDTSLRRAVDVLLGLKALGIGMR